MTERPRVEQQRQHQRPHVLIVCDDPSLSEFLSEGLPLGGFWISVIASGIQAIEVFRLRQFDLIVLDASLTSFSWEEFVRRLRGLSTRAVKGEVRTSAPIVLVTDRPVRLEERDRELLGIDEILEAPLELDEIVRALHHTFQSWQECHPDLPLSDFRSGIRE